MPKTRIGEILLSKGEITQSQLDEALANQSSHGGSVGKSLLALGYVDETKIILGISEQLNIPFIELKYYRIKLDYIQKLPEKLAKRFKALVLDELKGSYLLGMADPTDLIALDEVKNRLDKPVRLASVRENDMLAVINDVYSKKDEITSIASQLNQEIAGQQEVLLEDELSRQVGTKDAPVIKLLNTMFEEAIQLNVSDIHIEPEREYLRIRQRIDGVLHETIMQQKGIASALVSRLKLMASLNISEKRIPQDGRFVFNIKGRPTDVRISTMPIRYGESVVLRILDTSKGLLKLEQLGMSEQLLKNCRSQIARPYGMIVVTGPTGSGKTTTLYAALNELNKPEKKIISVEDPVEYTLERINQVQVNPKIGLTFANILRSGMRQDPDIILIGEMRDEETARIGIRASITGHLVLSTLHTNDAVSSAVRLIDMGVEGYMVASALRAIIAQRLLRRNCEFCVTDYTSTAKEKAWLEGKGDIKLEEIKLQAGAGCARCKNTGFRGRIGIYELLELSDKMTDALRLSNTLEFVQIVREDKNFVSLTDAAIDVMKQGVTSPQEVLRVVGDIQDTAVSVKQKITLE